jgi:hypothetical protein
MVFSFNFLCVPGSLWRLRPCLEWLGPPHSLAAKNDPPPHSSQGMCRYVTTRAGILVYSSKNIPVYSL